MLYMLLLVLSTNMKTIPINLTTTRLELKTLSPLYCHHVILCSQKNN